MIGKERKIIVRRRKGSGKKGSWRNEARGEDNREGREWKRERERWR